MTSDCPRSIGAAIAVVRNMFTTMLRILVRRPASRQEAANRRVSGIAIGPEHHEKETYHAARAAFPPLPHPLQRGKSGLANLSDRGGNVSPTALEQRYRSSGEVLQLSRSNVTEPLEKHYSPLRKISSAPITSLQGLYKGSLSHPTPRKAAVHQCLRATCEE